MKKYDFPNALGRIVLFSAFEAIQNVINAVVVYTGSSKKCEPGWKSIAQQR